MRGIANLTKMNDPARKKIISTSAAPRLIKSERKRANGLLYHKMEQFSAGCIALAAVFAQKLLRTPMKKFVTTFLKAHYSKTPIQWRK